MSNFPVESFNVTVAVLSGVAGVHDSLHSIETIHFSDGTEASSAASPFHAYEYIASYADLIRGLGDNPQAGFDHYVDHGYSEGRSLNSFDALDNMTEDEPDGDVMTDCTVLPANSNHKTRGASQSHSHAQH